MAWRVQDGQSCSGSDRGRLQSLQLSQQEPQARLICSSHLPSPPQRDSLSVPGSAPGPLLRAMQEMHDLDALRVRPHSVYQNKGGTIDNEFTCSLLAAGPAHVGLRGQKIGLPLDLVELPEGSAGIVLGDVLNGSLPGGASARQPFESQTSPRLMRTHSCFSIF